jgi:hypothetical protein
MLKTCGVTLLTALLSFAASAGVVCALGPGVSSYQRSADLRPSSDAMQLASTVSAAAKSICASSCPAVMVFRNTTAANAMLVADAGQARLVYSPAFFASVHDNFGDAGIIAIIAHELGHALDDALGARWIDSKWTPELRADAWAGCSLAKIDLKPGDLEAALKALAKYPSASHPSWPLRVPALRAGYMGCGGEGAKFKAALR